MLYEHEARILPDADPPGIMGPRVSPQGPRSNEWRRIRDYWTDRALVPTTVRASKPGRASSMRIGGKPALRYSETTQEDVMHLDRPSLLS